MCNSSAQHQEHLGGGGFSTKDEVRCNHVQHASSCCWVTFVWRMLQSERRRAIEVGAGAEPEGDLEEEGDEDWEENEDWKVIAIPCITEKKKARPAP